ncbi:isochorismatase family protein, partial [Bacillus nitratireducens]|uniref:isochorismatase family protein n=1 Tax=Bacillus nitratireducens TaxID=2026193 RepID=UPI002842C0CA
GGGGGGGGDGRGRDGPRGHVQHVAIKDNATFSLPKTECVHIHEKVRPVREENVILKHYPNSLRETDLLERLQRSGMDHVVRCGMMTPMCIDAT